MPATIHEPSGKTTDPLPPPDAIPDFGMYREEYAAEAALRGLPPVPRHA